MSWVRLDEEFAKHPKVVAAGPLGMAMQVAALCYCNQYLTDGFVPRAVAVGLLDFTGLGMRMWSGELSGGGEDASWQLVIEDLVDAGLWEPVEGGWRIHDYHDYQPSREHVLSIRKTRQQVGSKGGKASGQARREASAKQFGQQTRSKAEARDQAGSQQPRAPAGTDERHGAATPPAVGPETLTSRDSRDEPEANSSATAEANGQAKTNPGPVPVTVKNKIKSVVAPSARPVSVDRQVFDFWRTERGLNGNTVFGEARKRVVTAALKAYPLEDVLDAIRGVALDPWPDRASNDDLLVILRLGGRGNRNNLEFFRNLYRDGPTRERPPLMPDPSLRIVPDEEPLPQERLPGYGSHRGNVS